MEVYIVYVVYQYDGYDNTEVYGTKEKGINAANQLLFEFKQDGYVVDSDYDDSFDLCDDLVCIRLGNKDGEVEITLEKKVVR